MLALVAAAGHSQALLDSAPVHATLMCSTRLPAGGLTQPTLPLALQLGISEKTVLREFHKDAMDLHDVCQDLERVCKELQDPSIRAKRRVSGDSSSGLGTVHERCLNLRQPAQGA